MSQSYMAYKKEELKINIKTKIYVTSLSLKTDYYHAIDFENYVYIEPCFAVMFLVAEWLKHT